MYNLKYNLIILENTDLIYSYWKDDYVKITNGKVSNLLINNTFTTMLQSQYYTSAYEHHYYFFDTDRKIDELVEVQYDYELINYEVETTKMTLLPRENASGHLRYVKVYNGLMDDFEYEQNPEKFFNKKTRSFFNNKIKNEKKVVENLQNGGFFGWWASKIEYEFDTIVNLKDVNNIEDERFKTFFKEEAVKSNGQAYQWAFSISETERHFIKEWRNSIFPWDTKVYYLSECNEVKQTMITWLHFRTDNQNFKLNALDIPRDTESIHVAKPISVITTPLDDFKLSDILNPVNNLMAGINSMLQALSIIFTLIVVVIVVIIVSTMLKPVFFMLEVTSKKKNRK